MPSLVEILKEIRWGMGVQEIQNVLGRNDFKEQDLKDKNKRILFIDSICRIDSLISFNFHKGFLNKNKLNSIFILVDFIGDKTIKNKYIEIKNQMIGEYGKPKYENSNAKELPGIIKFSEVNVWKISNDSVLKLSLGLKKDSIPKKDLGIKIYYGDIKNDFFSKLCNFLNFQMDKVFIRLNNERIEKDIYEVVERIKEKKIVNKRKSKMKNYEPELTIKEDFEFLMSTLECFSMLFLYIFLKMEDFDKKSPKEDEKKEKYDEKSLEKINETISDLAVILYEHWPEEKRIDFTNLFNSSPREKRLKLFAEMIYFLIFYISNYSAKYFEQDKQKIILDSLFSIFKDRDYWLPDQPEQNSYNKYVEAKNPLELFFIQLSISSGISDSIFLLMFTTQTGSIFEYYINPIIDGYFK